ncbi:MAG: hypothetical protein HWQ37_20490 [Nostoc sp. NMS4]|nr:hypothetical protein [Nostoc sp. NMS4]
MDWVALIAQQTVAETGRITVVLHDNGSLHTSKFLSLPNLDIKKIWFPIVIEWLEIYFEPQQIIYLAIDRTNWGCLNLFMVSVIWDKRSFPIYFELLQWVSKKKGYILDCPKKEQIR